MASPRHIRVISRITTVVLLVVVGTMISWFVTGMPSSVESSLSDALYEPCPTRYAAAQSLEDSAQVDGYVLKPRSRFNRAITCGSLTRQRATAARRP